MNHHPEHAGHDELTERLSAYLDGELDADATRHVEDLLVTDSKARDTLRRLERAWDMLDRLPRTEVPPSFTQTTVEMVALRAGEDLDEELTTPSQRRAWLWPAAIGAALAASIAGFFLVARLWPDPNEQLLSNLPLIEQAEAYRMADSVEFLRELKGRGLFTLSSAPPSATSTTSKSSAVIPKTLEERRQHVEQLSAADKEQLLNKQQRFASLPADERERLTNFHRDLEADSSAAELKHVLDGYHAWLAKMPAVSRAELLAIASPARLDRIQQLQADEQRRVARLLSPEDTAVIASWVESRVLENSMPTYRAWMEKLPEADRRRAIGLRMWERGRSFEFFKQVQPPKEHEIQELIAKLSPAARQQLEKADTFGAKMMLMSEWMRQAIGPYMSGSQNTSEEDLLKFLESLPESDRSALLALPTEEFQQAIRRLHYLRNNGPMLQPPMSRPSEGQGGPNRFRPRRDPDDRGPDGNGPRPGGPDGDRPGPGGQGLGGPRPGGPGPGRPEDRRPEDRRPEDRPPGDRPKP